MSKNNAAAAFGSASQTGMKFQPTVRKGGASEASKPKPVAAVEEQIPEGIPAIVWQSFTAEQKAGIWASVATAAAKGRAASSGKGMRLQLSVTKDKDEKTGEAKTPKLSIHLGSRKYAVAYLFREEAEFLFGEGGEERIAAIRSFYAANKDKLPLKANPDNEG